MSFFLLRLLAAVVFIVVETVFFVALHTYFSRPVDQMKNWFIRRSKRTVIILLPVLFVTNFAVTFLFSGLITTGLTPPPRQSTGVSRFFSDLNAHQPARRESMPSLSDVKIIRTPDGLGSMQEPIPGFPADDTLH